MNCLEGTERRSRLPWPGDRGGGLHAHFFSSPTSRFAAWPLANRGSSCVLGPLRVRSAETSEGTKPMSDALPTAARAADPGIRALYRLANRWQAWLDAEAARAKAPEGLGATPAGAAAAIGAPAP